MKKHLLKNTLMNILKEHSYQEVVKMLSEVARDDSKFFTYRELSQLNISDDKLADWMSVFNEDI